MDKLDEAVILYNSDSSYPHVTLENKGKMKETKRKRIVIVVEAHYQKMKSSLF